MPIPRAAIEILPPARFFIVSRKPEFSVPTIASSPTSMSSNTSSAVSEERMPSLSSFLPTESPFVPAGTTKAVTPSFPFSLSVTARITYTPPTFPCVMNICFR
jgi:hypothetical protein